MARKPAADILPPADSPLAPQVRRSRVRKDGDDAGARDNGSNGSSPASRAKRAEAVSTAAVAGEARRLYVKREISGIALLLGALFLAGALIFGSAPLTDASCTTAGGAFGPVGGCIRWSILGLVGALAAVVVPLIPAVHALRLLGRLEQSEDQRFTVFTIGLALITPVAAGLARLDLIAPGSPDILAGLWGAFAAFYVREVLGTAGAWIVIAIAFSALAAVTLGWNPVRAILSFGRGGRAGKGVHHEGTKDGRLSAAEALEPDADDMPSVDLSLMGINGLTAEDADDATNHSFTKPLTPLSLLKAEQLELEAVEMPFAPTAKTRKSKEKGAKGEGSPTFNLPSHLPDDELPGVDLLSAAPNRDSELDKTQLDAMGAKLIDSLRTFKVEGTLTGRTTGPTVTQFEIEPGPGVKVRQFANLANDLALAMRAPSIRVVAPIPGKGAVGIEVPNPTPEMVAFRDMLESRDYQTRPMALPIGLGKDLEGRPVIADLAKMPHLLIAGATGSGKSVCVNTLVTSLVYRHTPKTLRFLMVDPKMVELSVYNVLPHLRHRVVTDNRDAAYVLKWAVLEMQERYELLAENGARNIQDFNAKVREGLPLRKPKDPNVAFEDREYKGDVLPYIVVVIDELADLMMTVAAEVETPLAMLAQKARAIGIHLILATQRPSVNVITGLIKANFPSRIAFRVASQIDSRTIIDGMGAESLLGNGDMLFIPPGKSEPARLQGAFLSNEDTERLMGWYTDRKKARKAAMEAQGLIAVEEHSDEADVLEAVRAREALEASGGEESAEDQGDRDKLFREAAEVCIQHQGGSTSLLQRRLKVGYGRAARIIDQLHLAGVLGPPDGSKPRDVLVGLEDLDRIAGERTAA